MFGGRRQPTVVTTSTLPAEVHSIKLLGGAAIEGPSGASRRAVQRARIAMLAILALSKTRSAMRERITAVLWPESDTEHARHLLREHLYRLREAFGDGAIESVGDELRLDPAKVRCDVWEFEEAFARAQWERAVSLYAGPLLDGFFFNGASEFEHWAEAERSRLADMQARVLESLATELSGRGDLLGAVMQWRQRAATDPQNSRVALRLMEALEAAGDRAGALRHATAHTALLKSELGAVPDAHIETFAERLRSEPPRREPIPNGLNAPLGSNKADAAVESGSAAASVSKHRRWPAAAALAGVLLLTAFLGIRAARSDRTLVSSGRLTPRPQLIIADFNVRGMDSALGRPLAEVVRMSLSQSPEIALVRSGRMPQVLQLMQRPPNSRVDVPLAREIAVREGAAAIVDGEAIYDPGGGGPTFLLTLRIVSADSGHLLASLSRTARHAADLIPVMDGLARDLRLTIGESLKSVRSTRRLPQLRTWSVEALRLLMDATTANNQSRYLDAVPLLHRAVAIDSGFAQAWRMLGVVMLNSGAFPQSAIESALEKAYQNRTRATEVERLQIEATYFINGPHADRAKAIANTEYAIAQGDSSGTMVNLASLYRGRRQWASVEVLWARRIKNNAYGPNMLLNLAQPLFALGKRAEAEEVLASLRKRLPTNDRVVFESMTSVYQDQRYDDFAAALHKARSANDPALKFRAGEAASRLALLRGRLADADRRWIEAKEIDAARGALRPALDDSLRAAGIDVRVRDQRARAAGRLDASLAAHPLRDLHPRDRPYLRIATLYAMAGRPDKAHAMLKQFHALRDTALVRIQQPAIHRALAEIALAESRPLDAVIEFRKAYRLPDGPVGDPLAELADLGRAFDKAQLPDSAIAMFESYLSTPLWNRLATDADYLAHVHRRLGELYEQRGDAKNAVRHYDRFRALWKNADAELQPRMSAASRRVAQLTQQNKSVARGRN